MNFSEKHPISHHQPSKMAIADFNALIETYHPFAQVLGLKVLEMNDGHARVSLKPGESHQRLGGIIAGPMLMGLADFAAYAALVGATGNAEAVTANLTINFLRKSPPGEIIADATVLKVGRLSAVDVSLIAAISGDILAHSVSTWSLPKS
jgi:uncharacterized protein (TIGR00369 family)